MTQFERELIKQMEGIMKRLQQQAEADKDSVCLWTESEGCGYFSTDCGQEYGEGPEENGFIFCPHCGKKAVEKGKEK